MLAWNSNEQVAMRGGMASWEYGLMGKAIALMAVFGLLAGSKRVLSDESSLTEHQVKSLFLMNFAKYVEWPSETFADTNAPIWIGVIGESRLGDELAETVKGRRVEGRPILIRQSAKPEELEPCQILFIGSSEDAHLVEILSRIADQNVLTVGESDQFMERGGVINFVKKDGKIRLEINLEAARHAKLEISSKLLSVADVVLGREL